MFTALVEWPTISAHTAVCSGTYIYLFQATELSRFYVWVGCTIHVTIQEIKVSGEDDKSVCLVPVMRWKAIGRTPSLWRL